MCSQTKIALILVMQLQLPIFPEDTKLISSVLGVYEKDQLVQYIVNGLPVYSHSKEDYHSFRYITSNFIAQGLCRKVDISRGFHVSNESVLRWYKKYQEVGEAAFYGPDARKGRPYKIIGSKRARIQHRLDKGESVNSIAKAEQVAESAIRYQIKQGYLKKNLLRIR